MDTVFPTNIQVLDKLLAVNLNISLWSARKKLSAEDFGEVPLPPEDLASLGSKRIAPPESLRVFGALKARAFNYLDKHGVRFLSGWAIPEEKCDEILQELCKIKEEFFLAKESFLLEYNQLIQDWVTKHAEWGSIIASSLADTEYVRSRLSFTWQVYRVAPEHNEKSGLAEEVEGLGNTLFDEIAHNATDIWNRVYVGKTEVTHKALSPLHTLHAKLIGLSFVEPHVTPVADIIQTALSRMPAKGSIHGADLLLLQGVVSILRDTDTLISYATQAANGKMETVLGMLQQNPEFSSPLQQEENPEETAELDTFPSLPLHSHIPSMGLW